MEEGGSEKGDKRSDLVAASEEDLSPGVGSSPQVKQPGCPPGGEKWQSAVSREGPSTHSGICTSPVGAETGRQRARDGKADRDRGMSVHRL